MISILYLCPKEMGTLDLFSDRGSIKGWYSIYLVKDKNNIFKWFCRYKIIIGF